MTPKVKGSRTDEPATGLQKSDFTLNVMLAGVTSQILGDVFTSSKHKIKHPAISHMGAAFGGRMACSAAIGRDPATRGKYTGLWRRLQGYRTRTGRKM